MVRHPTNSNSIYILDLQFNILWDHICICSRLAWIKVACMLGLLLFDIIFIIHPYSMMVNIEIHIRKNDLRKANTIRQPYYYFCYSSIFNFASLVVFYTFLFPNFISIFLCLHGLVLLSFSNHEIIKRCSFWWSSWLAFVKLQNFKRGKPGKNVSFCRKATS